VGAVLEHLEFLQFHPTALRVPGINPAPLLTEALRGAGAWLVDARGTRFMLEVDPRAELAPRDVVARAVAIRAFRNNVWLDARHIEDVEARFPGVSALVAVHGLSLANDLLPIAPAMHYAMGGIRTNLDGRSSVAGLWAVGECANTGVHGANRLASNSLLEGLLFADRAGREIHADLNAMHRPPASLSPVATDVDSGADAHPSALALLARMRSILTREAGVLRTEPGLAEAELALADLLVRAPSGAWHAADQLRVAAMIARAARGRRESRGGHRRADFPKPRNWSPE
jgi:L-aspartate oxidase